MIASEIEPAVWSRLSPWLDELLDLPEAERAVRLATLRDTDSALADQLLAMLARLGPLEEAGFLQQAALPPPAGLAGQQPGQRVGPYVLSRELGHGGMGTVWLASRADGRYQGQVAVKFMRPALLRTADNLRFLREGQMLARLDHPNIARLLDAGIRQPTGQPYLVLDYVEGQPIDQHCEAQQLDLDARVRLVRQVLAAVAHAHSRLILHRDLKPSNILVTAEGVPKLLDFGVGKLIGDGAAREAGPDQATADDLTRFAGLAITARYAAPEQLQGQEVTTATDVYALGVLLYGLLGGGHPTAVDGASPLAQMQAVLETVPRRLSDAALREAKPGARARARRLRGDLDTIVARALKKDPAERYANAAALSDDLRRWLGHEPIAARPDSARYRIGRYVRRHRRVFIAAGTAGALALTTGAGLAIWQAREARAQRAQAEALVEFMLGDLQRKLVQIGRPELLQAVGERALAHFANEDLASLDAAALAQRARALRMIGESAQQRLDHPQARAAFEQAANTTALLLAQAPKDMQRLKHHGESLERMVYLVDRTSDKSATLALCRQVSAVRWQMAALAPQDPGLRLHAIDGDQCEASLLQAAGRVADSLSMLARIQQGLQSLPAGVDGVPRVQAMALALTGRAQLELGHYAEAADALRAFFALQQPQHSAQPDVNERDEHMTLKRAFARAVLHQGLLAPAMALAAQALASAEAEAEQSPDNLLLAEAVIRSRVLLATLQVLGDDRKAAHAQLAAIDARLARWGQVPADNAEWHVRTLGELLVLRARLQPPAPSHPPAAQAWIAALQAHADHVARLDAPGRPLHSGLLTVCLAVGLVHGDALLAQGQTDAARERWQAVADRALPAAQAGFHPAMQHLALAGLRLGQPQQARPWVERLQASNWRHPDLADLQQRLAAAAKP